MALTAANRGTPANNTAASSWGAATSTGVIPVGALAVMCIAYDNAGGSGADPYSSIADARGNDWQPRLNVLRDPGAANAGIVLRIFTSLITTQLEIGDLITVSFSTNVTAKAATIMQWTSAAGTHPEYAAGSGNSGSGTAPSVNSGAIPPGDAIVGAVATESGTTQTFTADTDTSDGSWSSQQQSTVGSTTSGAGVSSQRKVVTGLASQTYNPTLGISSDYAIGWIQIHEVGDPQTVTINDLLGGATLPALTVTPGAVTVSPALLGGATIQAPEITIQGGVQSVTPDLLGGATIPAPTIQPGAVSVSPALLGGASLLAPTIQPGVVTVSPARLGGASLLAPTVLPGAVSVSPALLGGASLPAPTILQAGLPQTVSLPLLGGASLPALTVLPGPVTISPALLGGASLLAPSISVVSPGTVEITLTPNQTVSLGAVAQVVIVSIGDVHHAEVSIQ